MKITPKGRKHENCEVCDKHPLFDLDEKIYIHGDYYTKEWILNHYAIVDFLNECEEQDYELDPDDIRHILDLDFEYVRKQNQFTHTQGGIPLTKSRNEHQ